MTALNVENGLLRCCAQAPGLSTAFLYSGVTDPKVTECPGADEQQAAVIGGVSQRAQSDAVRDAETRELIRDAAVRTCAARRVDLAPVTDHSAAPRRRERKTLDRQRLADVAGIVTPDTILCWYRRLLVANKYDGSQKRRPGRPSINPGSPRSSSGWRRKTRRGYQRRGSTASRAAWFGFWTLRPVDPFAAALPWCQQRRIDHPCVVCEQLVFNQMLTGPPGPTPEFRPNFVAPVAAKPRRGIPGTELNAIDLGANRVAVSC